MRFLSVLLIACMVLLSSFSGIVKPAFAPAAKMSCCKKMADTNSCHKQKDTGNENNGCAKSGCEMMLTCSVCGFVVVEPVAVKPVTGLYIPKPIDLYTIGDISSYQPSSWKPPQAC